jgi:hypothetical protein
MSGSGLQRQKPHEKVWKSNPKGRYLKLEMGLKHPISYVPFQIGDYHTNKHCYPCKESHQIENVDG